MPKINGVDVDQLMATVEAVKETPGLANFEFRIENKWVKGGHNRSTVSDFHGAGEDHAHENPFVLDNGELCVDLELHPDVLVAAANVLVESPRTPGDSGHPRGATRRS